jgi:hypothetical protein
MRKGHTAITWNCPSLSLHDLLCPETAHTLSPLHSSISFHVSRSDLRTTREVGFTLQLGLPSDWIVSSINTAVLQFVHLLQVAKTKKFWKVFLLPSSDRQEDTDNKLGWPSEKLWYSFFFLWRFGPCTGHGLALGGFAITLILDTPHSVGLLWTSDQADAETSTWQHTTLVRNRHLCPLRDSNPQSQQVKGTIPPP